MNFRNSLFISLIGGVLLGLSWPTYGLYFLSFIGIIPFIYVSQKYVSKKRFLTFFAGFLLWNIISTYWLIYATTFGFLFAVLVNSLMMSTVFYLYSIVSKSNGNKLGYIFLVSIWICFEKFHLYWDFSWPWLNLGNVFSENVKIIHLQTDPRPFVVDNGNWTSLLKNNIWVKRPGTGEIMAEHYNKILSKKAKVNIKRDKHINWKDIES